MGGDPLLEATTLVLMSLSILFCLPGAIVVFIISRREKDSVRRKKLVKWSLLLAVMPLIVSTVGGILNLAVSR